MSCIFHHKTVHKILATYRPNAAIITLYKLKLQDLTSPVIISTGFYAPFLAPAFISYMIAYMP